MKPTPLHHPGSTYGQPAADARVTPPTFDIPRKRYKCQRCKGSGAIMRLDNVMIDCPECGGCGTVGNSSGQLQDGELGL